MVRKQRCSCRDALALWLAMQELGLEWRSGLTGKPPSDELCWGGPGRLSPQEHERLPLEDLPRAGLR